MDGETPKNVDSSMVFFRILILIFAEALGLYGLIVGLVGSQRATSAMASMQSWARERDVSSLMDDIPKHWGFLRESNPLIIE